MTTVFVYGTLKRGHSNWQRLLQDRSEFLGEALSISANYAMLDGGFPKAFECANGHPIFGELFEINVDILRHDLDLLEGHPNWYQRKRRMFRLADGTKRQAWIYLMRPERVPPEQPVMTPVRGTLAWPAVSH
jgi:gamma-glutamylcyclotransferase (GGCT)/AIG2-like uncharacterized protein YtfP